jgi:hypothetical protein
MSNGGKPWEVTWYRCLADQADVALAAKEGRNLSVGDELWRVAHAIGPVSPEHDHWAGAYLSATDKHVRLVSAAPVMHEVLTLAQDALQKGQTTLALKLIQKGLEAAGDQSEEPSCEL